MSVYKVAQDVEADDKLIGPFSFRQFIYLIIVAISIALAWALSQVFVLLAIIPLPVILFFGALALPLRKDQPMETYLAAIVAFHLKPKKRFWVPDGIDSLVEITAPKVVEHQRVKDLTQYEAQRRLSYLADIVDTRGWAVRTSAEPASSNAILNDVYYEAQQTEDILDESAGISRSLGAMIDRSDIERRQAMINRIQNVDSPSPNSPQPVPGQVYKDPYSQLTDSSIIVPPTNVDIITPIEQPALLQQEAQLPEVSDISADNIPRFDPYPSNMHQSVIQPLDQQNVTPEAKTPENTSEMAVNPDIINLANNSDLSIETIAHEANRLSEKHKNDDGEVVISLH